MTGRDIVKALTEADLLDRKIESFDGDLSDFEGELEFIYEESREYIGEDEVKFKDIHLVITDDGKWKLTNVTWIG